MNKKIKISPHNTFKTDNFFSPQELEKQEHLSLDTLKDLNDICYPGALKDPNRPKENFIDLLNWTEDTFGCYLSSDTHINKLVHNKILIDGQFLLFCELNNVEVRVIDKDSIVSWKSDNNFEKFFAQGVFLIKHNDFEFIHAALYHKGNQNEDEISLFILVDDNNYEAYINFRNRFDTWVTERDRSNLHIRVIDGDDIPYTKDHTWEELFLPADVKMDIKNVVENFLSSKDFYLQNKIPWKRGILLFGPPGVGKTSLIRTIISNYNFKPVTIVPTVNDEGVREAFAYAEEQSPSLLYFEDLDSLLERNIDTSSFLNLMDGIATKNGMLIVATANEIKKLKASITDRPSRFDRKYEIGLPTQDMAHLYLKRWFGDIVDAKKCRELARLAVKHDFSYAYLKELYISSMFEALSNNRKVPTSSDISKALDRLMKDKKIRSNIAVNTDKYFKKGNEVS